MIDLVVCVLLTCRTIVKSSNSIRQFLQLIQRNIHKGESFWILSVIKVTETIKYIKSKLHDKKKKKEVKMVHVPLWVQQLVTGTVPLIYPLKGKYW